MSGGTGPGADRAALIAEVRAFVEHERRHLAAHAERLARELERRGGAAVPRYVYRSAIEDTEHAGRTLDHLLAYVASPAVSDHDAFAQVMPLGGFALRRAAAARASLCRHTPTLRGFPAALDPAQSTARDPKAYTVDYLRGGYILYQQPGEPEPVRYADHPVLAEQTRLVIAKLYGEAAPVRGLAFTSGIAAIDSVNDVLAMYAERSGRVNVVGRNCWIEIRRRLAARDPRHFQTYDEADFDGVCRRLADPAVQAVCIEGIQNHPAMLVMDLERLLARAREMTFDRPTFLVIDHVMTFDTDVFTRCASPDWPANLCLVAFISGIKFLQNGFDAAKAGFVLVGDGAPADPLLRDLVEARAGSGRAPAYEELFAVEGDTSESLRSRMARYDRNTGILAREVDRFVTEHDLGTVFSPWLPTHPGHAVAQRLFGGGGRVVYVRLANPGDPDGRATLALYRELADSAASKELPLIAASNFGFALPHIHVVRHEAVGVSLRIGPGSVSEAMLREVIGHVCEGLLRTQMARRARREGEEVTP